MINVGKYMKIYHTWKVNHSKKKGSTTGWSGYINTWWCFPGSTRVQAELKLSTPRLEPTNHRDFFGENDPNQTSRELSSILIFRGVVICFFWWVFHPSYKTRNQCFDPHLMWNMLIFRGVLSKECNMFELTMNQSFQLLSHSSPKKSNTCLATFTYVHPGKLRFWTQTWRVGSDNVPFQLGDS